MFHRSLIYGFNYMCFNKEYPMQLYQNSIIHPVGASLLKRNLCLNNTRGNKNES